MSLLAVTSDPAAWILFATLVGTAVGSYGTAIFAGRCIRKARVKSYWDGYGACNRARHYAKEGAAYSHASSDSHSSHSEEMGAIGMIKPSK